MVGRRAQVVGRVWPRFGAGGLVKYRGAGDGGGRLVGGRLVKIGGKRARRGQGWAADRQGEAIEGRAVEYWRQGARCWFLLLVEIKFLIFGL